MARHAVFPEEAFAPSTRLRDKFFERAYRHSDIENLRTSVHYRSASVDGPWHKYHVSVGYAYRRDDGDFALWVNHSLVQHDTIQRRFAVTTSDLYTQDETIICRSDEVLAKMDDLDRALKKDSFLSLPYPDEAPIRIHGDLHFLVASWLRGDGDDSFTKDDVLAKQRLLDFQMR